MTSRAKTFIYFGIVAIVVTLIAFKIGVLSLDSISNIMTVIPFSKKVTTPPKATGNIDGVVNSLILDSTDEQTLLKTDEDASLINSDSQEIGNFSKIYNESEL